MLRSILCLSVVALQLGSLLLTEPLSVAFSDPTLENFEATEEWALYSWVSLYQSSGSCVLVWTIAVAQGSFTLCKQPDGAFKVCSPAGCLTASGSAALFQWEFIGVSVKGSQVQVCSSQWSSRSPSCTTAQLSDLALSSASTLHTSGEVEQYDLQLITDPYVDLTSLLNAYSCHSVCVLCFGPSFNACEEFFPLINLQSTLTLAAGQSPYFSSGDRVFRGRTYDSIIEYGMSGWFKLVSTTLSAASYCEIVRFANSS
jgi:hypothetical protein